MNKRQEYLIKYLSDIKNDVFLNLEIKDENYIEYLKAIPKEVLLGILERSFNEIFVYTKDFRIIYSNRASIRHYGLKPEEIVGKFTNEISSGRWIALDYEKHSINNQSIACKQKFLLMDKEFYIVNTSLIDEQAKKTFFYVSNIQEDFEECDYDYSDDLKKLEYYPSKDIKEEKIIGNGYAFCKTMTEIRRVAKVDISILLNGESGTGKTLVAKYIHNCSKRKDRPFFYINCAAIPEQLLESELFGYEPHAFTGASNQGKKGLIELADTGSLFLDEIGDLSLNLQAKLLDVLENQRFIRVGGNKIRNVDIRIISATNKDLEAEIKDGKFREDLFWRINTVNINLPPLRERKEDIIPLTLHFLDMFNEKHHKKKILSSDIFFFLQEYTWPGNIRQLKNSIERMVAITSGDLIRKDSLPNFIVLPKEKDTQNLDGGLDDMLENITRIVVRERYMKYKNIAEVGVDLKISKTKAFRLIKKYCEDLKPTKN